MTFDILPIDAIQVPAGRRRLDPAWVATLAWQMAEHGQKTPIEAVRDGETLTLIAGAHRLAAMKANGASTIAAIVKERAAFEGEAQIALAEISENLIRRELSALDRAVDIARWRDIYEATGNVAGRGRPKKRGQVDQEEISAAFCTNFSEHAQAVLGVSRRTIFVYLRIARIAAPVRERIALLPIADNQSELLALAAESAERQASIAALLTAEPAQASTVADAVAILDRVAKPAPVERYQKLSNVFARLKEKEQDAFFDAHAEAIERWLAKRSAS